MKRLIVFLLLVIIPLVACSEDSATESDQDETNDSSSTLKVSLALMGGPKTPDSWVEDALEEDLSSYLNRPVEVENVYLPGWEDAKTKINLMMSDPSEMTDVIWHWDMNREFNSWIDADIVHDLTPLLQEHGQEIINYYSKDTFFFHWDPDSGIRRIPADVSEPGTMTTIIRKDWLENLQLDVPTTLDEYIDVLRAFTFDDPNGTGQNDTYGLSGENLYRAFAPFFLSHGVDPDSFMVMDDGTVKYGSTLPEVRDVLEILQGLYKEGVIDPRMLSPIEQAQVDEIMANGNVGSIYRWVAFFNPDFNHHVSFKALNPEGEYMPIDPVSGPDGFASDLPADVFGWSYLSITDAAEDPEAVMQVLDRMAQPETFQLITFGIEGEHYEVADGQYESLITPDEMNNLGLGNYNWYVQRKDEANIQNTPEVIDLFNQRDQTSMPMRERIVFFKSLSRPAWNEYGADINTLRDETFWGIISGNLPITAFDDFIAQYPALGGEEVDREANELYKAQEEEYAIFEEWYNENIEPYK